MMSNLNKNESQDKSKLQAVRLFYWACVVLLFLIWLAFIPGGRYFELVQYWTKIDNHFININMIFVTILPLTLVSLYLMGIAALNRRRPYAVSLGRGLLILSSIIFFPLGTIFGIILWRRFNMPGIKDYLNFKK